MTQRRQVACICQQCQREFFKRPSEIKKGEGKYCTPRCYHESKATPKAERFWNKVNRRGPDDCWEWTAASKSGKWRYGILGQPERGSAPELAHRVSWELHHGPIPDGMNVLHRCDNPPCVNPNHLFLGTLKDNTHDMLKKRRHVEKLLPAQIAEIIQRYRAGNVSQQQLAKRSMASGQVTISRKLNHQHMSI